MIDTGSDRVGSFWLHALLGLSRRRTYRALLGVASLVVPLALLAVLASAVFGKAIQSTVTLLLINTIAVIGFGIYSGNTGIMSFGHVAFMNIGAHVSALLTLPPAMKALQLPELPGFLAEAQFGLLPAVAITLAVAAPFILAVGWPIARLAGASAIIATLALLGAVYSLSVGAVEITKGGQALFGLPRLTSLWVALAFASLAILIARFFRDSRPGLEVQAMREDELAAASIGVAIVPRRLLAWLLSGLVATVAGILLGHYLTVFSPREFYFAQTFSLLAMLIIGGMATVSGAVLGTLLVTGLIEILRWLEEGPQIGPFDLPQIYGLTTFALGICMILVMIKRRDGLVGFREIDELLIKRLRTSARVPAGRQDSGVEPDPQLTVRPRIGGGRDYSLSASHLDKRFGGVRANQDVSFSLSSGEILGLIGPNGSGKTTLLNMLSLAIPPSSGQVKVNGISVTGKPTHWMARNGVARTFQSIRLFHNLTVYQNVHAAVLASDSTETAEAAEARVEQLLDKFSLTEESDAMASSLSHGAQRRLEIARALATDPRLLLLDEPAAGMNEVESDDLLKLLSDLRQSEGLGILIVEHDLSLILRLCDRIIVLNKGEIIAEGSSDSIQENPAVIEAYIGTRKARRTDSQPNTQRREKRDA